MCEADAVKVCSGVSCWMVAVLFLAVSRRARRGCGRARMVADESA